MRVMSGTLLMPVRMSWRPWGLISYIVREEESRLYVIKLLASRTSDRKVSMLGVFAAACHCAMLDVIHYSMCSSCTLMLFLWAQSGPSMPFLYMMPSPGPSPSISLPVYNPPRCQYSRSLGEARFNVLLQEYRQAQELISSHDHCLTSGHSSKSDSNSALL